MAETSSNYQTKIGIEKEAERFFMREDGYFNFFDEEFPGGILRSLAQQTKVYTITNYSTAGTTLSDHGGSAPPVLPSGYGTIRIEASDAGTNLSARLASAYSGQELNLVLMAGSVASVIIYCSGHASGISGVNVIGLHHSAGASALSSISMRQSAGSFARVKLRALDSGDWAVVEIDSVDNVTERRA
jgi:hypothetical protein